MTHHGTTGVFGRIAAIAVGAVTLVGIAPGPASAADETTPHEHLLTWGDNSWNQTGTGAPSDARLVEPALLATPGTSEFLTVSVSEDHGLGVAADGSVWAWGQNTYGALGSDPAVLPESSVPVPVDVMPSGNYIEVAAGEYWSAALRDDGHVFAWGWGASGQLGNHTTTPTDQANPLPVRVDFPEEVLIQSIQAGALFGVAETLDGEVWTWGDNAYGQLGGGPSVPVIRDFPGAVMMPEDVGAFAQVSVASISVGAVTTPGALYGWGSNINGNLALGEFSDDDDGALPDTIDRPTASHMPEGATYFGTKQEDFVGFGLGIDGQIYVWGTNSAGLLGDAGSSPARTHPEPLPLPVETTAQIGCQELACAILAQDGRVYVWGDPQSGWFSTDVLSGLSTATVVPFTETHPVSRLDVEADNPFITATAEKPQILTEELRHAESKKDYSERIVTSGTPLITTTMVSGTLPEGLHLAADGRLEGTPRVAGEFRFTVRASSPAGEADHEFRLRVAEAAVPGEHHDGEHRLAETGWAGAGNLTTAVAVAALAVIAIGAFVAIRRTRRPGLGGRRNGR